MHSGIACILSKFFPHRRKSMPSGGTLTGLKGRPMWTSWGSTRPRARSCTWLGAIPRTNTDWAENGLRAAQPRTWGCWLTKSSIWPSSVCSQPRRPTMSWTASKVAWPAGQERWFCPSTLLWWAPTWSPASSSGALSTGKTWSCCSRSRGGPQKRSEGWSTSPVKKGWESWGCSAWRREAAGRPCCGLLVPEGAYKEAGEGHFTRACSDRTKSSGFKLKEGWFRSDERKKFFTLRVVRHWHRLPREAVATPSLAVFKARLVEALRNLV